MCSANAAQIDPQIEAITRLGERADVLLVLQDQSRPQLAPLATGLDYRQRRRILVDTLRARAEGQQVGLRAWLDARGIAHRDFWLVNAIQVRVDADALSALAGHAGIARIAGNPSIALPSLAQENRPAPAAPEAIEWGVDKIGAPQAWAAGHIGQNVVIAGQDTGYQWNHPALKAQYRGWNGGSVNHNRHWHDAIHDGGTNSCGLDAPAPCDDHGHGTHTAGTFAGDDGGSNQIGVAPGARWIGCRNMNAGDGTPARYIECMQWFLAPTDLAGNDPDPDYAPDIISNSWGCPPSEGCTLGNELDGAVQTLVDAGIFFVAAAGNDGGGGCSTILDAPATHDASFVVGSTTSTDALSSFSSRGPVPGSPLIRPDVVAPGSSVRSALRNSGYGWMSGTSMATPHVAGAAALVMSAVPSLKGQPDVVGQLLRQTARRSGITDPGASACGGLNMTQWPNHQAGWGRIDAWAAVQAALEMVGPEVFSDGFEG